MRQAGAGARIAGSALAVAIAVWLIPASIHIVGWRGTRADVVAFVPPVSRLWWGLVAAAIILAALRLTARGPVSLSSFARGVSPLLMLLAWTIPYIPGLAIRFPLLLVMTGPGRWIIAATALAGALWSLRQPGDVTAPIAAWATPRRVCLCTFIVYASLGWYVTRATGPLGDEPQYLTLAHSLLVDHDIAIGNNFDARDYRLFYQGPIKPHLAAPGINDKVYTFHAPGTAAIVLPGYAIAGYRGAVLTMALVAALAVAVQFRLALALAGPHAALLSWFATAFTIPFAPFSWSIYSEMPAALLTALAAWWMWSPLPRARIWWLRGMALAVFPWLHLKFVLLFICLVASLALRLRRHIGAAIALASPLALSVMLWLFSYYVRYGVFNPIKPYQTGSGGDVQLNVANSLRVTLGLLFDRAFGVLPYSPIFFLVVVGWWYLIRDRNTRGLAVGLTAALAVFLASLTRTFGWWGGSSAPARFLVPAVPLVAPMLAMGFRGLRQSAWRALGLLALLWSIGSLVAMTAVPSMRLLYNSRESTGRLTEAIQGDGPLSFVLPSFIGVDWHAGIPGLAWWFGAVLCGIVAAQILGRPRRRTEAPFGLWMSAAVVGAFLVVESIGAGGLLTKNDRLETARNGRGRLLAHYDGGNLIAKDLSDGRRLNEAEVLERGRIAVQNPYPLADDESRDRGETETLPAGTYEALVWFGGGFERRGEFLVSDRRTRRTLGRKRGTLSNPSSVTFALDAPVSNVTFLVRGDTLAADVVRLEIRPLTIVPRTARR